MTAPIRAGEDPLDALKKLRQSADPLDELKALKATSATEDPNAALHAEYKRGDLAKRMATENAEDRASVPSLGRVIPETLETVAAGFPGAKLAISGYRKLLNPSSDLGAIQGEVNAETSDVPYASALGRTLGSLATPLGKLSPAKAGAVLGGAEQLLNNDPNSGVGERAFRGTLGALGGAAAGKVADVAATGIRAALPKFLGGSGNASEQILRQTADRAKSAKELYAAALAEGQGKQAGAKIQEFLAEPDIQEIIQGLQETRQFRNVPADTPEMLDAIYKNLSDRVGQLSKGLASVNPSKPNIGRFAKQDAQAAQQQLLSAMEAPDVGGRMMPTYREAVEDFAKRSGDIKATQRGADALYASTAKLSPSLKNLTQRSPEAFAEWAKTASPDAVDRARQGILGQLRGSPSLKGLRNAPDLLRAVDRAGGKTALEAGEKSLLAYLNALTNP